MAHLGFVLESAGFELGVCRTWCLAFWARLPEPVVLRPIGKMLFSKFPLGYTIT